MESAEDDFDPEEEDFWNAAMECENLHTAGSPPAKRRSVEIESTMTRIPLQQKPVQCQTKFQVTPSVTAPQDKEQTIKTSTSASKRSFAFKSRSGLAKSSGESQVNTLRSDQISSGTVIRGNNTTPQSFNMKHIITSSSENPALCRQKQVNFQNTSSIVPTTTNNSDSTNSKFHDNKASLTASGESNSLVSTCTVSEKKETKSAFVDNLFSLSDDSFDFDLDSSVSATPVCKPGTSQSTQSNMNRKTGLNCDTEDWKFSSTFQKKVTNVDCNVINNRRTNCTSLSENGMSKPSIETSLVKNTGHHPSVNPSRESASARSPEVTSLGKNTNQIGSSMLLSRPNNLPEELTSVSHGYTSVVNVKQVDSSPITTLVGDTRTDNTTTSHGNKRKRKFPGPAGALPRRRSDLDHSVIPTTRPSTPAAKAPLQVVDTLSQIPPSQSVEDQFNDALWNQMKEDLEPQANKFLTDFSLASIVKLANKKQLPKGKVPVLCVMIDSLNVQNPDASVMLKDPTGELRGTIHRDIMKEYVNQMQAGTVLVLRQVGVFSPSHKSHYLNITPNNVVKVYSKNSDGQISQDILSKFRTDDFIVPDPLPVTPVSGSDNLISSAYTPQPPAWNTHGTGPVSRPFRPPIQSSASRYTGHAFQQKSSGPLSGQNSPRFNANVPLSSTSNTRQKGYNNISFSSTINRPSLIHPPAIGAQRVNAFNSQSKTNCSQTVQTAKVVSDHSVQKRYTAQPSGTTENLLLNKIDNSIRVGNSTKPTLHPTGEGAGIHTGHTATNQNRFTFRRPVQDNKSVNKCIGSNASRDDFARSDQGKSEGCVINTRTESADLWADDQLDELLTGINDDDLLAKF